MLGILMNKSELLNAVETLDEFATKDNYRSFAHERAVAQFNALLTVAKNIYSHREDIQAIEPFMSGDTQELAVLQSVFADAVSRLKHAINLGPLSDASDMLNDVILPTDIPVDVRGDLAELKGAIEHGMAKSALLLSGSIAEALLLHRFQDESERGPGMAKLVSRAKSELQLGRDTRRAIETLTDYRDLIHPRAEKRNNTLRDPVRVETAVNALKLLCLELEDDLHERFDR